MKIYLCSPPERQSGIGLYTDLVADGIRQRGHSVTVGRDEPREPLAWDVIHVQIGSSDAHLPQVELLRSLRGPGRTSARTGPAVVATLHDREVPNRCGSETRWPDRFARRLLGVGAARLSALWWADATVVLSEVAALTTPRWLQRRVHRIPHPLPRIDCGLERARDGERIRILIPGFFGPAKVGAAIAMVRASKALDRPVTMTVGTPHPALRADDWTAFRRAADDVPAVMIELSGFLGTADYLAQFCAADLSFVASSESFDEISAGYAYSLAAGTPVVVPDHPQYQLLRRDPLDYPLFYRPDDDRSVLEALRTVLAEHDLVRSAAASVRSEYLQAWSLGVVGDAHVQLYTELLRERATGGHR